MGATRYHFHNAYLLNSSQSCFQEGIIVPMITSIYASLLAILYMKITIEVIKARKSKRIIIGLNQDSEMEFLVRSHSNFIEYTPLFLILLFFFEKSLSNYLFFVHIFGILFLIGRYFHFRAFNKKETRSLRIRGMQLTVFPILILAFLNLMSVFLKTFLH